MNGLPDSSATVVAKEEKKLDLLDICEGSRGVNAVNRQHQLHICAEVPYALAVDPDGEGSLKPPDRRSGALRFSGGMHQRF
ncbi:hypothetical protein K6M90_06180 [Rhizobium sp. 9T]|uniref:Uncharacterized protein n=1 Tax=Rhizobium croatiense TaxID=2867516 RepID=A0ABS7M057_9HYPH|nr:MULTISPECIES: hypothetical protein [Rhizobium]MBY4607243.1 hypothetical protein [Rhizobium croatiense]MBY4630398.1 hypothetical protein [Rhizobium croatiense]WET76169.1 hypothetical protein PYR68_07335 [Rhizobium croatiense]